MEKWKSVKGYEGVYEVSNTGRVRSIDRLDCGGRALRGQEIKPQNDSKGIYLQVSLNMNGQKRSVLVHRLVAEAFVANPYGLPQINHIDENSKNNNAKNLEWCTPSYNINYGAHNEHVAEAHARAVCQYTTDGVRVARYSSSREASRATGISQGSISHVVNGDRRHAGGYIWKYAQEGSK